MSHPKNIIINPTERWYHGVVRAEIPEGTELYWCKDSHGNDVPIFYSWATYTQFQEQP